MDPTAGMPQSRLDELIARFREQGRRLTPQRLAVLRILGTSREHPSVQQIHDQVRLTFPTTSLATIYATIGLLEQMGEVMPLALPDGANRYDGRSPQPHPHLFCDKCGRIVDVEIPSIDGLPFAVARKTGYRIVNYHLAFFGVCPSCQQRE
jgi:Fur family peroxide stress response transcriptional regulator